MRFAGNAKRIGAMLLVLVCIPLFLLSSDIDENIFAQNAQTPQINQNSISAPGIKPRKTTDHFLPADVLAPELPLSKVEQQSLVYKDNGHDTSPAMPPYRSPLIPFLCVSFLNGQYALRKVNHHLIIPHSAHAPPQV